MNDFTAPQHGHHRDSVLAYDCCEPKEPALVMVACNDRAPTTTQHPPPLMKFYVDCVVQILAKIDYGSDHLPCKARRFSLADIYIRTSAHFTQRLHMLDVNVNRLQALIQTMVRVVFYGYPSHSLEVASDLCIYLTYSGILNDCKDKPEETMKHFINDLINGIGQRHTWWQAMNKHLVGFLKHYGPLCSLGIFRSTLDFFQGCWIEQHDFQGFPGSQNYPDFLRRLNGLGHCVAATLFPAEHFDEAENLTAIASIIAEIEQWELDVNDLLSFYKEYFGTDKQEQANLVANYAHYTGTSLEESLARILDRATTSNDALGKILSNVDTRIRDVVKDFMFGYVTWHLTDRRYRMNAFIEQAENLGLEGARELRRFWEIARGCSDESTTRWALPLLKDMIEHTHD
ncbi:terpenoid synthase, partial [Aureobasidium melanogenum]